MGAIRERTLTPQDLEYVFERALAQIEAGIAAPDPEEARRRLAAVDGRIERAVDLAVEEGDLDPVKRKLAALRAERDAFVEMLRAAPPPFVREAFRKPVQSRALDLREAFGAAPGASSPRLPLVIEGAIGPRAENGASIP